MINIHKNRIEAVISDLAAYLITREVSMSHAATEHFFSKSGEVIGDSLLRVQMASYVGQLFNLTPEIAEELSSKQSLSDWSSLVLDSLSNSFNSDGENQLTFMTSGTTSAPKRISHKIDELLLEARHWADTFDIVQIYSFVPAHHIYGFIWTVLLASIKDVPVINGKGRIPFGIVKHDLEGLIIAVPDQCPMLMTLSDEQQKVCDLVLSTAPCSDTLLTELNNQKWRSVSVIYGSTETGAVGIKQYAHSPFRLLPFISKLDMPEKLIKQGKELDVQDCLEWSDSNHFYVKGRKDGVVQHRGYNLQLSELKNQLLQCKTVTDAEIKLEVGSPTTLIFNLSIISADDKESVSDWIRTNVNESSQPNIINWNVQ